jgi:ABC-type multidrug transport system ATPase subunit
VGSGCDIEIPSGVVSAHHGEVATLQGHVVYRDLGSTNGTWLDGTTVEGPVELTAGSVLSFAPKAAPDAVAFRLVLAYQTDAGDGETPAGQRVSAQGQTKAPRDVSEGEPLVIDIVEKSVGGWHARKTILSDVHLHVDPGEFVLILGGSGAGKSTFINAVMGNDKAEGTIMLGDTDVYAQYERIKSRIGYVPQQDLVRGNDTVRATLEAAAQLRMPADTPMHVCAERAAWAAEMLGLRREGDTLVGRLSGGQRKRLSIAVELVGDPTLFFLDEPDSGLDGVMARLLMENLSQISALGKIVMVITHGPDRAADLFDKVVVLAKSDRDGAGHLLFCGPVDEAKAFFGASSLEAIVKRINRTDEGGDGRADEFLDKWEARQ